MIPDSGPLMSLGRINRLDLLDRFNCPAVITDMVVDEVLRCMSGAPDARIFRDWFPSGGNRIQTIETSIGLHWNALPPDKQALRKRIKDAGETAIWQFSNTFRKNRQHPRKRQGSRARTGMPPRRAKRWISRAGLRRISGIGSSTEWSCSPWALWHPARSSDRFVWQPKGRKFRNPLLLSDQPRLERWQEC